MKMIVDLIDQIDDEMFGAQTYAEKYIEYKAKDESSWAQKFKEMASDEIKHAMVIHELAVKEIESLKKVYVAPVEMEEKWNKAHKEYVEKLAIVKQILSA